MHPELENLITMALADGEVTEKERAIILRKAEALGEDKDEIEMILDGKIAELQNNKPKVSNKEGDLKKCPSCGADVKSFNIKCPVCEHEFRNIESIRSVKLLEEKINKIKETDSWKLKEIMTRIIINHSIPNTKEDLLEFIAYGISKGEVGEGVGEAWYKKCEESLTKLEMIGFTDSSVLPYVKMYRDRFEKKKKKQVLNLILLIIGVIGMGVISLIFGYFYKK